MNKKSSDKEIINQGKISKIKPLEEDYAKPVLKHKVIQNVNSIKNGLETEKSVFNRNIEQ